MKKRLEADLVSIAHRILQLKTSLTSINYFWKPKTYEKLSVLRFVNEHYGTTKPTITTLKLKEIEDLYDSSDLPIATIIKMAGFVPIERSNRTTCSLKKSLLKKYFTRTSATAE
jgi:hypothetical protein